MNNIIRKCFLFTLVLCFMGSTPAEAQQNRRKVRNRSRVVQPNTDTQRIKMRPNFDAQGIKMRPNIDSQGIKMRPNRDAQGIRVLAGDKVRRGGWFQSSDGVTTNERNQDRGNRRRGNRRRGNTRYRR